MANKKKLKKWTQVYPQGTKEGDEEQRFFIALARHPKYKWRSTSAISKEANLTKERVEQIIQKYYKSGMVVQNPQNEDQWGYWERLDVPDDDDDKTVVQKDHEKRIQKVLNPSTSGSCCGPGGASNCGSKSAPTANKSGKSSSKAVPSKVDFVDLSTAKNPPNRYAKYERLRNMENYIHDSMDVERALDYVLSLREQNELYSEDERAWNHNL